MIFLESVENTEGFGKNEFCLEREKGQNEYITTRKLLPSLLLMMKKSNITNI